MTKVCFRIPIDHAGEIVAVFPEIQWDDWPSLACYQHTGQHGPCTADWVRHETVPAKPNEYESLLRELTELVGYDDLVIIPRMPRVSNKFYNC